MCSIAVQQSRRNRTTPLYQRHRNLIAGKVNSLSCIVHIKSEIKWKQSILTWAFRAQRLLKFRLVCLCTLETTVIELALLKLLFFAQFTVCFDW